MLFGDEERFSKPMTPTKRDGQVYAVKVSQNTDEFIGPGSYYKNDVEEQRGGWQKKSFSRREPMTPSSKEKANGLNRSDFYTHGVMTSYGAMAMPTHSPKRPSPGPGYYEKDIIRSPSSRSIHSPNTSYSLHNGGSTTPRFAFDTSAVLKDGVLFVSRENNARQIGPGQYAVPTDTLRKHSFNVRASPGKAALSPTAGTVSRKQTVNDVLQSARGQSANGRAKSAPRMRG